MGYITAEEKETESERQQGMWFTERVGESKEKGEMM